MNERIPALMKQYRIPGCNIALVKDCEVVWTKVMGMQMWQAAEN
jgi:hypothetical protein